MLPLATVWSELEPVPIWVTTKPLVSAVSSFKTSSCTAVLVTVSSSLTLSVSSVKDIELATVNVIVPTSYA